MKYKLEHWSECSCKVVLHEREDFAVNFMVLQSHIGELVTEVKQLIDRVITGNPPPPHKKKEIVENKLDESSTVFEHFSSDARPSS
jgi:hypothetical protein